MPEPDLAALREAAPPGVAVERHRDDFHALLGAAVLSISQAGYNTVLDVLQCGPRMVLVPFAAPGETEQTVRAEWLAGAGRAVVVPEAELTPARLAAAIDRALALPPPLPMPLDCDGAAASARALEAWLAARPNPAADPWDALARELDAWSTAGRVATLWWRDDDAAQPSAALDRLLALGVGRAPLALAVVPEPTDERLARRLATAPNVRVLQHGWAHCNHRPAGERSAEYGADRPLAVMTAELARGRARLAELFGARFVPVLVPPWNRADAAVIAALPGLGYRGASGFGPRPRGEAATVNTHVDPIAWRAGRGFVGEAKALGELTRHLADRRTGAVDADEPTGLLTHHLVHDAALWRFLDRLLEVTAAHRAVKWLDVREVFS